MVDPTNPEETIDVQIDQREPVEQIQFAWDNYTEPLARFNFVTYLRNSVIVTTVATAITLLINSMAAFALSKYKFPERDAIFVVIIATLMIPVSVILVPVFLVITQLGMNNTLWGVIIPGAATPTGVFLLRNHQEHRHQNHRDGYHQRGND
ncbi:MAG: carbohydrate ABC transporter permease, partial [Chloroflexota bacterium]